MNIVHVSFTPAGTYQRAEDIGAWLLRSRPALSNMWRFVRVWQAAGGESTGSEERAPQGLTQSGISANTVTEREGAVNVAPQGKTPVVSAVARTHLKALACCTTGSVHGMAW